MNTVAVTCTTEEGVTVETVINTDTMEHCVVEDNITCCENLLPSFVEAQFSEDGRWTPSAGGLSVSSLTARLTLSHCLAVAVWLSLSNLSLSLSGSHCVPYSSSSLTACLTLPHYLPLTVSVVPSNLSLASLSAPYCRTGAI